MEGTKKRRLQGSCDSCRFRKKACDSAQRPGAKCSNCVAFGSECTHIAAMSRKNGGVPLNLAMPETTEELQVHITAILEPAYTCPKDTRVLRPLLVQLARYARELEAKVSALEHEASASPTADVQTMEGPMSGLSISENKNRQYGAEDDTKFIKTVFDLKQTLDPHYSHRRPAFWTRQVWQNMTPVFTSPLFFPPSDLIYSFVDHFLDTTNNHICLLHGPSFRRDVSNGIHYTSRQFGSVVLAVCAIASRTSNDTRVADGHQLGWEWFKQLRPLDSIDYASPGCLWDLQLFVLMVLYMYRLSIKGKCWLFAGMGIRLAQHMRIHRKRRSNEPWTPLDESLKRAWWALITVDCYASSLSGRMICANVDEFDTDLPLEIDDEYWPGELLADPLQPWTQPAGVVPKVTAWVLHLKLLEIYGFAQKTIYSVRRSEYWDALSTAEWGHNVAVELDSALNKWIDALPDHLRWNPHQPSEASAVLYSTYYWVQIQIHRPFIINADRSFDSIAICTNAARSCAHVLQAHHAAFHDITLGNMLAAILYSAIVLLLNAANAHSDGAVATPRDLEDVYKLMEILQSHEEMWQVAGRYHDVIAEVFALLKAPKEQDSRKRKEHHDVDAEHLDWGDPGVDSSNTDLAPNGADNLMAWEGWSANSWEDFGAYLSLTGINGRGPF
ncbi:hypothetical protein BDZ89DRAFT_1056570 [Hymenopellis radicata]|nr:hypothetical protein BDZ89DRAFT_1056570 [Hymenopellis radicata]